MFAIGNTLSFVYNGKNRVCKIETVKKYWSPLLGYVVHSITGYDYSVEGYRTFVIDKTFGLKKI